MDKTEREDFEKTLKTFNYKKDDFEISEKDYTNYSSDGSYVPVQKKTIVKNKKNGKQKIYESGYGTKWVIDFENDIKQHFFD